MKSTGIVRKVDELGRIVLPIELRRTLDIAEKDAIEIYVDGEAYDPGENTLSVPTYANVADEIVSQSIQTQSELIFNFE